MGFYRANFGGATCSRFRAEGGTSSLDFPCPGSLRPVAILPALIWDRGSYADFRGILEIPIRCSVCFLETPLIPPSKKTTYVRLHVTVSNTTWARISHPSGHPFGARHAVAFNPLHYHTPYSNIESGIAYFAHSNGLHFYERISKKKTLKSHNDRSRPTQPPEKSN